MIHPLRVAFAALALAGALAAQQPYPAPKPPQPAKPPPLPESDPRNVPDPRDIPDPRTTADPRGTPQEPFAQLEGPALYDQLYANGEDARLAQALKEDGWNILGYIDSHCEGWLALLENGAGETAEGKAKMAEMQAKGRKLAALADKALIDSRFSAYVENFYGWDEAQRKSFRQGQELFQEGSQLFTEATTPEAAKLALTPLLQSLEHSRPLSDTWGQSMALALMGRVQRASGMDDAAAATMVQARELGHQIRDLSSVWDALGVQYEVAYDARRYQPAREALQQQYLISVDLKDEKVSARITTQLVTLDMLMAPR